MKGLSVVAVVVFGLFLARTLEDWMFGSHSHCGSASSLDYLIVVATFALGATLALGHLIERRDR